MPQPIDLRLHAVQTLQEIPPWTDPAQLACFFHEHMHPWHDTLADVRRGLEHALSPDPDRGGFLVLAAIADELVGGLTMLDTGMGGYVPRNLLLFVAVHPDRRGQGIGQALIEKGLSLCEGAVKLHVEYDNPAKRLYERVGFTTKYAEMRYQP